MYTHRMKASPSITTVSVRELLFCRTNPAVWFHQVETQFALACVTMDVTRFNHVLVGLDEEAIELVSDVLDDCKRLREQFVKRLSLNEAVLLNHLLTELTLGDWAPS